MHTTIRVSLLGLFTRARNKFLLNVHSLHKDLLSGASVQSAFSGISMARFLTAISPHPDIFSVLRVTRNVG